MVTVVGDFTLMYENGIFEINLLQNNITFIKNLGIKAKTIPTPGKSVKADEIKTMLTSGTTRMFVITDKVLMPLNIYASTGSVNIEADRVADAVIFILPGINRGSFSFNGFVKISIPASEV